MKHLLLVPQLLHALCVNDLLVWHSSPRLEKTEVIFILPFLPREPGIIYITIMGGASGILRKTIL